VKQAVNADTVRTQMYMHMAKTYANGCFYFSTPSQSNISGQFPKGINQHDKEFDKKEK